MKQALRPAPLAAALALALALLLVATASGSSRGAVQDAAGFLASRQNADGGFGEAGRSSDPALTAWVVLGLKAAGRNPATLVSGGRTPADYLQGKPYPLATDLELRIMALVALGETGEARALARRLQALRRSSGAIGTGVNSTIWGVLALRSVGLPAGVRTVSYLKRQQRKDGGWSWLSGIASDSNDTAAAIQALRAAGVAASAKAIRRGLAYLRRLQNADGGFELSAGRGSDAQSTAWAIQAFRVAGRQPGKAALAYLARLRRGDGSYRYSTAYATTPVWVTAQVVPALAGRSYPLP